MPVRSYLPGTACHANIVATFGQEVVAVDGTINRPVRARFAAFVLLLIIGVKRVASLA